MEASCPLDWQSIIASASAWKANETFIKWVRQIIMLLVTVNMNWKTFREMSKVHFVCCDHTTISIHLTYKTIIDNNDT